MSPRCFDFVIHGNLVHTPKWGQLEIIPNVYVGIKKGVIVFIENESEFEHNRDKYGVTPNDIHEYYDNHKFIVPGFIDLHVHSAQYAYAGTGTDIPLMKWLNKYAFPSEKRLETNKFYTKLLCTKLIEKLISHGTTTVQIFGTIHLKPNLILANIIKKYGLRAFIGKVNMDQHSPNDYIEETNESIQEYVKY